MKKNIGIISIVSFFLSRPMQRIKKIQADCILFRLFCATQFVKYNVKERFILTTLCLALLITAFAQDAKSYYDDGLKKASEGKFEEAIKLFDKTIALNPKHYMAWHDKGRSELTIGLFKKALADFDQAITLNPKYLEGWLLRGTAKYKLRDYNGALADNTHVIAFDSNNTWGYFDRGLDNEALGKMDAACADYKKASALGMSIAKQKLAICNGASKKTNRLTTAIQDANAYYDQGYQKEIAGEFEEAVNFFDKTINLKADYFEAWIDRGYCKSMLGLFKESITDYDQAIKLSPGSLNGWLDRGIAKYNSGNYNGALTDYSHVIALDSNNAQTYFNRGLVFKALGKRDSACADFNKALRLGLAEAHQEADMCNSLKNTADNKNITNNFVILDADGAIQKLVASTPQILTANGNTAYIIPFLLILSQPDSPGATSIHLSATLKPDPDASIDIQLNNGSAINLKNAPNNQSQAMPISTFIAILNEDQKTLLSENDIEKISFKKGDMVYVYSIKDENSGNLKNMLGAIKLN